MQAGDLIIAHLGDGDLSGVDTGTTDFRTFSAAGEQGLHDALLALQGVGGVLVSGAARLSPSLNGYAAAALALLDQDESLAFASLGAYRLRPFDRLPFITIQDGSDGVYIAAPPLGGAVLGKSQVEAALRTWTGAPLGGLDFLARDSAIGLFPRAPVAAGASSPAVRSQNIDRAERRWRLEDRANSLARYDRWFEIEPQILLELNPALAEVVGGEPLTVDIYAVRLLGNEGGWVLTTRGCKQARLSFGLELQPVEANVSASIPGEIIRLARREDVDPAARPFRRYLSRHVGRAVDMVAYLRSVLSGKG